MAIGRKGGGDDYKLLVIRIKNKVKDKETGKDIPITPNLFEISEKVDDKWIARPQMESAISGNLTKIELGEKEWEEQKYKVFKFYLDDPTTKERILLDTRSTMVTRNIFNAFLNLKSFENISLSLYKKPAKDKKEYTNIAVRQNDELIRGKYDIKDIPQAEEIKNSKGVVISRDFQEVDQWYTDKLADLAKIVNSRKKITATDSVIAEPETGEPQSGDQEVPF